MKHNKFFRLAINALAVCALSVSSVSCSDDDGVATYPVTVSETLPEGVPANASVKSGSLVYTELNTGAKTAFNLPLTATDVIPAGTYNIEGNMVVSFTTADGATVEKSLRAVANQVVISTSSPAASLKWFFYNPDNTLVFGEIFVTGSPNAKGTGGLYDSYFTIYNNTDEVQYADGLAICESKILNSNKDKITTASADPEANFTTQVVYVIPGNGTDVAIQPGESIKIVDQAIDWNNEVAGALNHLDADFEWYDEVTTGSVRDTDNPQVPNLNKWYSYSATIFIPNNQCLRSYALVRFPAGMTAENYLAQYDGTYTYISETTGKEMNGTKCYLIKNDWILDGVNLCNDEQWVKGSLSTAVDMSYASISTKKSDASRFGKKFARKVAGTSAAGNTVLMDTNDSASDFEVVSAR
ncbi:MAG: DUF4876 domain-containing protein [Lachnoclostridium sp.]|nr:DUF4876 domain-containing protein [Lachnoclostridium sp.]